MADWNVHSMDFASVVKTASKEDGLNLVVYNKRWKQPNGRDRHQALSLSNERLRLDKNVNKGFSPEMNSLLVCKNRKKSPPESTHGKSSFWPKSKMAAIYTESNIEMDITVDLSKMETQMKCPFQLILGFQIT